jgi:hypothetical protein
MGGKINQIRLLVLLGAFLLSFAGRLSAADDIRGVPMRINLILDGSREMRASLTEASAWLCDYVVDRILREGDRLDIWMAGEKAQSLYSGVLQGEWKEPLKSIFRSVALDAAQADFTGALREAAAVGNGRETLPVYTLLVCGSSGGLAYSLSGEGAAYLRYSRIREFSGWRAVTVALDAEAKIREAARAYLAGN